MCMHVLSFDAQYHMYTRDEEGYGPIRYIIEYICTQKLGALCTHPYMCTTILLLVIVLVSWRETRHD